MQSKSTNYLLNYLLHVLHTLICVIYRRLAMSHQHVIEWRTNRTGTGNIHFNPSIDYLFNTTQTIGVLIM